jgi:IS5 family transposase
MGYKQMNQNITFAELSLFTSMEHNRSLKRLEKINRAVDWSEVEAVISAHYTVGTRLEGADAYPPLLLMKALLLQKWYQIDSDPELENQINDRISFKKFLGLSFDVPSPDHSTFSRFRGRLSQEAMREVNSVLLRQFSRKWLVINEGIAVDARLIQSASHPLSSETLEEVRRYRETPEGQVDVTGKPLKFSRDLDSDWTVKNGIPHYGMKEHVAVDTKNGLVLMTELTPASVHDSTWFPYCVAASLHTGDPMGIVYADKGYYGAPNRGFLAMNGIADGIMRKDTRSTRLTAWEKERNKAIAKLRYIVEQYFGLSHLQMDAFKARFTRIIRNSIDALFRQMAFNIFRGGKILGTT